MSLLPPRLPQAQPTDEEMAHFVSDIVGRNLQAALNLEQRCDIKIVWSNEPAGMFRFEIADGGYVIRTNVTLRPRLVGTAAVMSSQCTCYRNECHHAEAALIRNVLRMNPGVRTLLLERAAEMAGLSPSAEHLLATLRKVQKPVWNRSAGVAARIDTEEPDRTLFYRLDAAAPSIVLVSAKMLKKGGYSKNSRLEGNWHSALETRNVFNSGPLFSEADRRLARELFVEGFELPLNGEMHIGGSDPGVLFTKLAATGRFLGPQDEINASRFLAVGPSERVELAWEAGTVDSGFPQWTLVAQFPNRRSASLVRTTPFWYHDPDANLIGPIENIDAISPAVLNLMRQHVCIEHKDIPALRSALSRLGSIDGLPVLPSLEVVDLGVMVPTPVLTLKHIRPHEYGYRQATAGYVTGLVSFEYQGASVAPSTGERIDRYQGGRQVRIQRMIGYEASCLEQLEKHVGRECVTGGTVRISREDDDEAPMTYTSMALQFQNKICPILRREGWEIRYAEDFDLKIASEHTWQLSFEAGDKGWYNVRLEIENDGQTIDLIAVLRDLLNRPEFVQDIRSNEDAESAWWSRLPSGEFVTVPVALVRRLARLLLDIGSRGGGDGKPLAVSRFDVDLLNGLGAEPNIVVQGADDLKSIAAALAQPLTPLDEADLTDLALPLRPYQKEGVAWLRTRLNLDLGAVLGDEMAIGKTYQALAHIWLENRSGQHPPSLILVPPGLISKWLDERDKFIPQMRVGLYHGAVRRGNLAQMRSDNHAMLTTYSTLVRDLDEILAEDWHIVACDEGHDLRNPAADMSRAVHAIKARQKLIISGTPLQNRLDDLWTVMNIAVPGLLRDRRWFRQRFVLEPQNDTSIGAERSHLLGRITQPFRLSRTNDSVGNAIPKANNIYRYIDMGLAQSEVYETVRATMHKDVRNLVAATGLAKNQISILAAIGKLRQICCHPALVKSSHVPPDTPSAKLDFLLGMVDELDADGRSIVIVSQWVQMLQIISDHLTQRQIAHRQIIGEMDRLKRAAHIKDFRSGRVRCLLMSLKVGGVGIDLPEGDDIIIVDPWWNHEVIKQAIFRLTREYRDKHVNAYHLIIKGSLEEGVLKIAERKGEMIAAVMEGGSGGVSALGMEDIETLFAPSDALRDRAG